MSRVKVVTRPMKGHMRTKLDEQHAFLRWILEYCNAEVSVLEVGDGEGLQL